MLILLNICKELQDFCGFVKIPDVPLFKIFKRNFLPYIQEMFQKYGRLYRTHFCQTIDTVLANTLTFDTSGVEIYVFMSLKTILKLSILLSKSSNHITRIILTSIHIKWFIALCHVKHFLLLTLLFPFTQPKFCIFNYIFFFLYIYLQYH